ncbi:hypothetical protein ACROYT_G028505 [Oculina patagonica]
MEIEKKRKELERQEIKLQSAKEELNKRREELDHEIDDELCQANENIPQSQATEREGEQEVALRTVPIILKKGNRKITVNCLLDEGSDTTYVNEDVVNELGLTGEKEPITVKVANDQTIRFMSGTFEIGLGSTDGRVDTKITAKTSIKIWGGLRAVNWIKIQDRWNHLRGIPFPSLTERKRIDVLLGEDHYELMYSMKEVTGGPNEPCARLCPLGWIAIGTIQNPEVKERHSG